MRRSLVLALLATSLAAVSANAQTTTQKCEPRQRGTSSSNSSGTNRTDPTLEGNKNCVAPPPPAVGLTSISGTVFFDLNQDGVLDPDEVGISGWTVQVTGPMTVTVQTQGDGTYSITGLVPGNYTLCVLPPAGWTQISPTASPACTSGIGYAILAPSLAVDTGYTGKDFGYISQ
jgi:hypothetical protein